MFGRAVRCNCRRQQLCCRVKVAGTRLTVYFQVVGQLSGPCGNVAPAARRITC